MEHTSLASLGKQYAADVENLDQMITACKERRRFAIAGGNSKEAQRLERLAEMHTQQRRDLITLAGLLRHYYDGGADTENATERED